MKNISTLVIAAIAALAFIPSTVSAKSRHSECQTTTFYGYNSCGQPLYRISYIVGYTRCGEPIIHTRIVVGTSRHESPHYHGR
jgi:hypothetical protein